MEIQFKGRWDSKSLAENLQEALETLEDEFGVKALSNITLNICLEDEHKEELALLSPTGRALDFLVINNPKDVNDGEKAPVLEFKPRG
ncbi:hypothetical protein PVK64_16565 [Aliivibrio sp. S4TY2]|mgnify:CR=1 FL=1|uniref:Uncharacterized protein n=1 Tax=Aliivibrio finisterrensis TaxID=511998 RepID=A0A6N6RRD5_9GAMM|nr:MULTISPECIES: hypothetical protein [Aliivibrio]KAB2823972.1 hypothetical protein F8B77_13210 [Aliivibrio finisterrensis]MDD9157787.1 hypothetical protein [Aliivibrio sp. S4TY2]MDD9161758.1 hypothetical protein [Aliivibrio sp. S4TY1]MDD9165788.1 hypothetical protein [Aliivibrio sp. S4MY2]MDD9169787.1 hypothetical protein [Aliivibrio sp. S4MY4]